MGVIFKGGDKLKELLEKLKKNKTRKFGAGYFPDQVYPGDDKTRAGKPIAQFAAIHNFGTSNIPARPFLTFSNEKIKKDRTVSKEFKSALDIVNDKTYIKVGHRVKRDVTLTILESMLYMPLKPQTSIRKGHSTPLVETHVMKDEFTWRKIK